MSIFFIRLGGTAPLDHILEDFVYFLKENKTTLDKVPNGSNEKCSNELILFQ